jgi:aldose 1-epimerase
LIPTGEIASVTGTPYDFRRPTAIGERIDRIAPTTGNPPGGYDLNYVIDGRLGGMRLAATVVEPRTGRVMEVWTDQPGIQFYSGNFLDGSLRGKRGVTYDKHAGLCLETQHFPDSINQPEFPSTVLNPRQTYHHVCVYRMSTR